jgi:hypothetical protein
MTILGVNRNVLDAQRGRVIVVKNFQSPDKPLPGPIAILDLRRDVSDSTGINVVSNLDGKYVLRIVDPMTPRKSNLI